MKTDGLEALQTIENLKIADGPDITVGDCLPFSVEVVKNELKALRILKNTGYIKYIGDVLFIGGEVPYISKENDEILKVVLKNV